MVDVMPQGTHLNESPLFRDLTESEMRVLFEHMEHHPYEVAAVIIEQGTENNGLWLIGAGACEVVRHHQDTGKQQVLAKLGAGTVFGEMSFFQKTVHSADIRCITPVTAHKLTRDAFEKLQTQACPTATKILRNLVQVLADRLHQMDHWICELVDTNRQDKTKQAEWHQFRAKLYSEWDFS